MNWKTICLATLLSLAGRVNAQHGLHISGFVNASITVPTDSVTNLGFSFDVVDIDVEKELAKGVSVRADLDATVTVVLNLTVGFEFNQWLGQTFDDTLTSKMGWLVMLNYSIGDFGITFRQDAWGKSSSTTFSSSYGIADGAGMLF